MICSECLSVTPTPLTLRALKPSTRLPDVDVASASCYLFKAISTLDTLTDRHRAAGGLVVSGHFLR